MSERKRIRFIILSEGKRDYDFARAFLQSRFGKHYVSINRAQTVAAGLGSGEQRVRERYPVELKALRKKGGEKACLVVMIDGDNLSARERRATLEERGSRAFDEKVLIIVPRRNLETWFAWLDGERVDEQTNYKLRYRQAKPTLYGKKMAETCSGNPAGAGEALDSLHEACQEIRRISSWNLPRL
jgi:hypothetical protein